MTAWLVTDGVRAGFDPLTGALVALRDESTGWDVLPRPELGRSFRMLLPLPERRHNLVEGADQPAPAVEVGDDRIAFHWSTVRSQHGGEHPIGVTVEVVAADGRLTFHTRIDNRSELTVENVFAPYFGDVAAPAEDRVLEGISHDYGSGMRQSLSPVFESRVGYFGTRVPTQLPEGINKTYGTPCAPFRLLQGSGAGLYLGVAVDTTELVVWHAELWPGYGDSLEHRVPDGETIGEHAVAVRIAAVHVPFIAPGADVELTPVVVEPYAGDWHVGADLYASWRDSWLTPAPAPAWVNEPHSWQQVQLNSPEDERRHSFRDLVSIGEEAAAAGVGALQIVGFNIGGQDRNNPFHDPDPLLGGAEELRDAIRAIQAMGVKVVLFSKFTWADRATRAFRERFVHDAVKDPYGDYYMHPGYTYETVTQLLDINTRRLIPMCFQSERYLQECERQFQILVDLGADGMLFDECLHHQPTLLCFDESHGHRRGAPTYANDRALIERLRHLAPEGYLMAGEGIYDAEFDAYAISYHRSEQRHHFPLHRFTTPRGQMMTAITGFDDRNMLAQCLLYRYVASYEPFNFTGRLRDYPRTLAYGRRVDALREAARAWVWDGTFRDTLGAEVTRSGAPHHPFAVYEAADGSRAVVVANYDDEPIELTVTIPGAGALVARSADNEEWLPFGGTVALGPRSVAVVAPQR